jgi:putative transposase
VRDRPSARAQADAAQSQDIQAIHGKHAGRYGTPRIHRTRRQRGPRHSQKRVARLLREKGLCGEGPRRFVPQTTDSAHDHPVAPNRLAEVPAPTAPNQSWVADLTYVRIAAGWLFLAVILDLFNRRVVGWAAGATLAAATVLAALQMARHQRQPQRGLLYHSDRGVQYAYAEHRAGLAVAGLEPSMSRAGNPYDNATMESFMATYKRECVGLAEAQGGYATRADATADFFAYAEIYYNRERLHIALGYQTPVDFETQTS